MDCFYRIWKKKLVTDTIKGDLSVPTFNELKWSENYLIKLGRFPLLLKGKSSNDVGM